MLISDDMEWCYNSGIYYEKNLTEILSFIILRLKSPVFYDIGANHGYYTIKYASLTKQIYAFEPVSKTFDLLKRNIRLNKINNAFAYKLGVSDENKKTIINLYNSCANDSIFIRNIPEDHPCKLIGTEKIQTIKLDSFVKENNIPAAQIIKIDVEGAELFVLNGARETLTGNKPLIVFEYSDSTYGDAGYSIQDIYTYFNGMNYLFFGISEELGHQMLQYIYESNLNSISNIIAIPENHFILELLKQENFFK